MISELDLADIKPGETDTRSVDFTKRAAGATIQSVVWSCGVSTLSQIQDPVAATKVGSPVFVGLISTATFSNMVNGVIYDIQIIATLVDNRVLIEDRNISCSAETLPPPIPTNVLTPERFQQDFPAFDTTNYSVESIQFWINIALIRLRETRWLNAYLYAQELFVAHELTLEHYNEVMAARNGGMVPIGVGPASSKSVNGVSVSYDYHLSTDPNAGYNSYYMLTIYGQRLWQMINIYGAGPIYIGGPGLGWHGGGPGSNGGFFGGPWPRW